MERLAVGDTVINRSPGEGPKEGGELLKLKAFSTWVEATIRWPDGSTKSHDVKYIHRDYEARAQELAALPGDSPPDDIPTVPVPLGTRPQADAPLVTGERVAMMHQGTHHAIPRENIPDGTLGTVVEDESTNETQGRHVWVLWDVGVLDVIRFDYGDVVTREA